MNQTFESAPADPSVDAPADPSVDPHRDAPRNAPPRPNTYPENVPRPADPTLVPTRSWWSRMWHNMGRDSILILPGLFISVIAFPVLIALFSISLGTFIIWIGALLLPLTLIVAGGFANLSRARVRQWGAPIAEVDHPSRGRGVRGWIGVLADGRRWLDLLFEAVFALPIRIFTFSVSVSWFFGALGGLTYFFWGRFLPDGNTELIEFIVAASNDTSMVDLNFGTVATAQFVTGFVLLVTFPFVLHAMARLEIAAITAGLAPGRGSSASAGKARAGDGTGYAMARVDTEGWFWLLSILIGVVLIAVGWPVTAVLYETSTVIAMIVVLAQSAALVLAVGQPIVAIIVGVISAAVGIIITSDTTGLVWPWTVTAILALIFLHLIVGLRHSWLHLVVLWSLSTAVGALSLAMPHAGGLSGAMANAITTASLTAGVSAVAVVSQLWIRSRTQLATERQLSAEQLAKRQELEERNRIAQELHDVVAHSMSVISVQATTAKYRLPGLEDRSADEFDSIAGSARRALTEMRGLLAILRGGRDADLAPQPTVDDIPAIVEVTRGSGAVVGLDFPAEPVELSPAASLTAFRVVQESLSNALRHSAGAPVTVTLAPSGGFLEIAVTNGPSEAAAAARTDAQNHLSSGFGLKGMRERVEALGGSLHVGPTSLGGFEVRATLPADSSDEARGPGIADSPTDR